MNKEPEKQDNKNDTEVKTEVTAPEKEPEEAKEEKSSEEPKKELPAKFVSLVESIEQLTVVELNELVKVLEDRFGVSAVAVASAPAGGQEDKSQGDDSEVSLELTAFGENKIAVIKVLKEALGLGLKEAKDMVESAPVMVKEGMKKENAEELEKKLKDAGATVTKK